MQAKDIMEPIISFLTPDMPLEKAVCQMLKTSRGHGLQVKGMVVKNNADELVGILSIKDVMRAMIPSYLIDDNSLGGFTWEGMLENQAKKVRLLQVQDVMSSKVVTVPPTATLMSLIDIMIENQLQRVPVKNKERKILGMVYIRDLYQVISSAICRE
jgi:CBS domain-containing protein